ncbi:MAG: hypothetical protein MMC33_003409 [Icmadophila ericetorum]|nr:hypothetical protein [Icmadophila ericetorum]
MVSQKKDSLPASAPDLEILGDQLTLHPGGYVQPLSPSDGAQEQNLVEHMSRFRENPFEFMREISLHVSGSGWRAYDDYIGQPIYYSGFSEQMIAAVMSKPMLRAKIEELAEKRLLVEELEGKFGVGIKNLKVRSLRKEEIEKSLREVAARWTDQMICKMESKTFIRGAYYLATQLLTRAYHQGIHVSSEEVLRIRAVAEKAYRNKHSLVFLPCHRSHVDYVSMQLICYRLGIALPTVIAGDNLNIAAVGPFLQRAGAMWIRRSFADDVLYTTLVQSYTDTLLQGGFNLECFVEGGRSRTGKLLPPKIGFLGFLLDSVRSGRVDDAMICPVSTQYDKVIETPNYISELLGNPKPKENLMDFLSASSILSLKLGRVDVRFAEPWSLKDFIMEQDARLITLPRQIEQGLSLEQDNRVRTLRTLGYKVLSDINAVSVVMPTALIGTVLLTLRGRGVGKTELVRRVEWLVERVRAKGGRVAHFYGIPTSEVVTRGLEVLGPGLVGVVQGLAEETYVAVDRFQLSFYRNMTIHLFISEALVSAAMYTRVKLGGGPDNQRISYAHLYKHVSFLSRIFRSEFIFLNESLASNLDKAIRGLEADQVIKVSRDTSGNVSTVELSATERQRGREDFDFYCFLIWPFVEASWLGAVSLMGLTPPIKTGSNIWLDMKQTLTKAQLLGKTLYHQGDLSYLEAVNSETLKNAYAHFDDESIITTTKSRKSNTQAAIKLSPAWIPTRDKETGMIRPEGALWDFIEMIAQSRREGKNRRDGATVSSRVLGLAERLGHELFETAAVGEADLLAPRKKRRNQKEEMVVGVVQARL